MKKTQNNSANSPKEAENPFAFSDKVEYFMENHRKTMIGIASGVVVAIFATWGYYEGYKIPREQKAAELMAMPLADFQKGKYQESLHGEEDFYGLAYIADQYKGTPSGDVARYAAGISALQMDKVEDALQYLEGLTLQDNLLNSILHLTLGDIYLDQAQKSKSIDAYKTAVKSAKETDLTAMALKKLGMAYEVFGAYKDALTCYEEISMDYPNSPEARDIDKYIAKAQTLQNN